MIEIKTTTEIRNQYWRNLKFTDKEDNMQWVSVESLKEIIYNLKKDFGYCTQLHVIECELGCEKDGHNN